MEKAEEFYQKIPDPGSLSKSEKVDFFVYFLTIEDGRPSASLAEINRCFDHCRLPTLKSLRSYLSGNSKGKKARFIRATGGYQLARDRADEIGAVFQVGTKRAQAGADLRKLLAKVPDGARKDFLIELITCFEAGANRATVIMCWILALDCLFDHILANKLADFNAVLATNTEKRIKVTVIKAKDDFSDIPEGKFIEFCRSSRVISNDVRKILDEKLGIRNSCGHPSGVKIVGSKALEFVEDLVTNVVLKYFN